jgi:hypothetical protein
MTDTLKALFTELDQFFNGGEGSGNFDHEGRPGEVGGSGEGGGGGPDEIKYPEEYEQYKKNTGKRDLKYEEKYRREYEKDKAETDKIKKEMANSPRGESDFSKKSGLSREQISQPGLETGNKIREYTSKMSAQEIHTDMRKMGIYEGNMDTLSLSEQQDIYAGIVHSYDPYSKDLSSPLRDIGIGGSEFDRRPDAQALVRPNKDGTKTILIRPGLEERIKNPIRPLGPGEEYVQRTNWLSCPESVKYVTDHEIGHVLHDNAGSLRIPGTGKGHHGSISNAISEYAAKNPKELVAEAWAMRQNGTESALAKKVNDKLLEKLKGKK